MIVKARDNQNIFDVCIQEFGTLEQLFVLLSDNNLGANSKLKSGQELTVNKTNVGDEDVKDFVVLRNITLNNNQGEMLPPIAEGDYNNDYNLDFG